MQRERCEDAREEGTMMTLSRSPQTILEHGLTERVENIRRVVAEIHGVVLDEVCVTEVDHDGRSSALVDLPRYVAAEDLPVLRADLEISLPDYEVLDLTETLVFLAARRVG